MRRNPRTGAGPSPWRNAAETAPRQLTEISSFRAVSFHRPFPARKSTGWFATARERASRVRRASAGVMPSTETPAISTPAGSFVDEPANARPSTPTISAMAPTAIAVRCQSSRLAGRRLRARLGGTLPAKQASVAAFPATKSVGLVRPGSALALADLRDDAGTSVDPLARS